MSRKTLCRSLFVLMLLPVRLVMADTLEMADGALRDGKYMGGSQNTIRFQVDGQVMTYSVKDVLAVTFATPVDISVAQPTPSAATAAAPITAAVTVPVGTRLIVRMNESLDSTRHGTGHMFTAILEGDLAVNGTQVASNGARIYGRLTQAKKSGALVGQAELTIAFTDIMIANKPHPIISSQIKVIGERTGADTARKIGVTAGIGALARGKSSKKRKSGARKGAAIGLGISALTGGKQVRIPAGTLLEFSLQAPFTYTP